MANLKDTRSNQRRIIFLFFCILFSIVLSSVVWKLSQRQASLLKQNIERDENISITREKLFELENIYRENFLNIIQSFGGLGFLLTGYFTWKNLKSTEEKQVTERFSKAVELLSESTKMEARIGGIYLLERIAKESTDYHSIVINILTSYIREKSPRNQSSEETRNTKSEYLKITEDIQVALTVIGKRDIKHDKGINLNLRNTNLHRANLKGANLSGFDLSYSMISYGNLECADLSNSLCKDTKFDGASLKGVNLISANINNAVFRYAKDLSGSTVITAKDWEKAQYDEGFLDQLKSLCTSRSIN